MSDLQCAATIIVARHGEAVYPDDLAFDRGGWLSPAGRLQAVRLGERLVDRRIAMVYSSGYSRAVQTAELAAARLDAYVRVDDDLREFSIGDFAGLPFRVERFEPIWEHWDAGDLSIGCPGAETGEEIVARYGTALRTIADEHRGETVLVVSHGGVMSLALRRLASNVSAVPSPPGHAVDFCATVEIAIDGDGCLMRSWLGEPVG